MLIVCLIEVLHYKAILPRMYIMGLVVTKPVFGVSNKLTLKISLLTSRTSLNIETSLVASLDRCAGWYAPLLFANPKDRFSSSRPIIILAASMSRVIKTLNIISLAWEALYLPARQCSIVISPCKIHVVPNGIPGVYVRVSLCLTTHKRHKVSSGRLGMQRI